LSAATLYTPSRKYVSASRGFTVPVKKDKALAIQVMRKYIRADDEVYGIGYDYFLAKYGDDLLSLPEAVRQCKELLLCSSFTLE